MSLPPCIAWRMNEKCVLWFRSGMQNFRQERTALFRSSTGDHESDDEVADDTDDEAGEKDNEQGFFHMSEILFSLCNTAVKWLLITP